MKKTILMTALLSSSLLFSAEIFKGDTLAAFWRSSVLKQTAEGISLKGKHAMIYSKKLYKIDPAKKYRMTVDVRVTGSPVQRIYAGYVPMTGKNKIIAPASIDARKNSDTELAADAKKGDTVLKVKNAKAWVAKHPYAAVVFNIKDKFADLPNFEYVGIKAGLSVKKAGDIWEVTLSKPLKKDYAAGTRIRQHFFGGSYIYNVFSNKIKMNDWQTFTGEITGIAPAVRMDTKFWPGTEKVQIIFILNSKNADSDTCKSVYN